MAAAWQAVGELLDMAARRKRYIGQPPLPPLPLHTTTHNDTHRTLHCAAHLDLQVKVGSVVDLRLEHGAVLRRRGRGVEGVWGCGPNERRAAGGSTSSADRVPVATPTPLHKPHTPTPYLAHEVAVDHRHRVPALLVHALRLRAAAGEAGERGAGGWAAAAGSQAAARPAPGPTPATYLHIAPADLLPLTPTHRICVHEPAQAVGAVGVQREAQRRLVRMVVLLHCGRCTREGARRRGKGAGRSETQPVSL